MTNAHETDQRLAQVDTTQEGGPSALPMRRTSTAMSTGGITLRTYEQVERFAYSLAESGFFKGSRNVAQAIVAIEYGLELGIPPVAAVMNIHIIEGKPTMSSNLVAARIRASRFYDYRIVELTHQRCTVEALRDGKVIGSETFTIEDAKTAGLSFASRNGSPGMWTKYPKNMLFARVITNLARFYFADLFLGGIYTAEEITAGVHDEGAEDVIVMQVEDVPDEVKTAVVEARDLRTLEDAVVAMALSETRDELAEVSRRVDPDSLTDEDKRLAKFFAQYQARIVVGDLKAAAEFLRKDDHAECYEAVEDFLPALVEEEQARAAVVEVEVAGARVVGDPTTGEVIVTGLPAQDADGMVHEPETSSTAANVKQDDERQAGDPANRAHCPEFVPDLKNEGDCMRCGKGEAAHVDPRVDRVEPKAVVDDVMDNDDLPF